jgi:hypothetical protein
MTLWPNPRLSIAIAGAATLLGCSEVGVIEDGADAGLAASDASLPPTDAYVPPGVDAPFPDAGPVPADASRDAPPIVISTDGGRPLTVGPELELEAPVVSPAYSASNPEAAFGGGAHLVVWRDSREFTGSGQLAWYAARVRPDGTVLDPNGLRLAAFPAGTWDRYDVAWDGEQYVVATVQGPATEPRVRVHRVATDGSVLDPDGRVLVDVVRADSSGVGVAIASNGGDSLVVWRSSREFSAQRVDRTGAPIGAPVRVSSDVGSPVPCSFPVQVVGDGASYLVTWSTCETDGRTRSRARLLDGAGVPQGPESTLLTDRYWGNVATAASPGSGFLVAFVQPGPTFPASSSLDTLTVSYARLSAAGALLGAPTSVPLMTPATATGSLDVAWNGTQYVLAVAVETCRIGSPGCTDSRSAGVQAVRIGADGTLVDRTARTSVPPRPFDPSRSSTGWSEAPVLSSSGDGQALVLTGAITPGYVRGHRVDSDLAMLGEAFVVSGQANSQSTPVLLGDDTQRVAFWTDVRRGARVYDSFSTRLSSDGVALDVPAREQARGVGAIRGATGNTRLLQVFVRENAAPARTYDLYARRFGLDGTAIDTDAAPLRLTRLDSRYEQWAPGVVWTGSEFVVAALDTERSGLFTIRVSEEGVASSPERFPTSGSPSGSVNVQVQSGRDGLLAVYAVGRDALLRARRLSSGGSPLGDELALGGNSDDLTLAYSGGQWLVAWATTADVLGVRVSDAGAILDATPLRLADGPDAETDPVLAPTPTGFLLTYGAAADVRVARIGAGGEVEDPGGLPIATRCGTDFSRNLAGPSALVTSGSSGLIAYESLCRYDQQRVFVRSLSW